MPNPRLFHDAASALAAAQDTSNGSARNILAKLTFPQTPEICLAVVRTRPHELADVEAQTPEICEAAIDSGGYSMLEYVRVQTPELCMRAIRRCWLGLSQVSSPTPEHYRVAVEQSGMALCYVPVLERDYALCLTAVSHTAEALVHVPLRHRTRELCAAAFQNNPVTSWPFIPDPFYDELTAKG
jgi:hypothetical protein